MQSALPSRRKPRVSGGEEWGRVPGQDWKADTWLVRHPISVHFTPDFLI